MLSIFLLPLLLLVDIPDAHAEPYHAFQLHDYRCQQSDGYESIARQCDLYVECQQNVAFQHSCPDGLHFNPKVQWPSYPCGYPSEVKCGDADAIQEPEPTSECRHRHGFFRSDSDDCGTYTLCHEGVAEVMYCPFGLVFNSENDVCDWPINVPECSHLRASDGFSCPSPRTGDDGQLIKFRYRKSCRQFIACQEGYPRFLTCAFGLHYDEKSESCVDAAYVTDCDRD